MAPTISLPITDSSEIRDFVLNQGNGVKGLSELGLKSLPEQYIQPLEERIIVNEDNNIPQESIPIIDMSNWEDPEVANAICDAAEKWGFFQVVNHGVPTDVLENVQNATHQFYGLPSEEKRKYSKEFSPSNSVRFGSSFSPVAEKALEWKDYLSLFYVSDDEAFELWPPVVGVGRHSDVSTLTILLQDDIGGLYVRGNNDDWIHVPPIYGSLVINVGDALQIMSNGRYKSVEHRVVANGSRNRISIPIFVNPRPQDIICPFPEALASGEKPIYKQVLYSEYVKHFFKKAHDGKKTVDFAKI